LFSALWRYRHFILASILGELRGRFARSRLGLFWSILHPLAQATIFALVLAEVLGAKIGGVSNKAAYPIYLMAGMAAWGLFSEIMNRCLSVFIEYAGTMKKIAFPRICLPVIVLGNALVNHVLLLAAIAVVFLFFGHYPGAAWLVLPLGIVLISMFAFGLGVMLGIFNIFSRDVGQVVSVVLQIWFWLTPIVYTQDIVPERLRWLLDLNPMVGLVRIYQDALLFDRWPDLSALAVPAIVSLALFIMSFLLFRRASAELVDVL
jgi:lipopolysaccharide transport system permease protein